MLKIYGIPNSQPVRAVVWPCLMHGLPFEFVLTAQNTDAKSDAYLNQVNPRGTVPAIDDDGFKLWESHAILLYLCEKHGWHSLWPEDVISRANIHQYLHFHHRNTRELVINWSRTLWPSVFGVSEPSDGWYTRNTFPGLQNNAQVVAQTLAIFEIWLANSRWVTGTSAASIADISAYEELGQNQPRYANCLDYSPFPNIQRWLKDMAQLPAHDLAHGVWREIGDINKISGGMKTIARANKSSAKAWRDAVHKMPANNAGS